MKKGIITLILPAIIALLLFGGAKPAKSHFTAKYFKTMFLPVSGNNQLLYAGKLEVSNGEYKDFINSLRQSGGQTEAAQYDYDTSVLSRKYPWFKDESFMKNYFSNASYDEYPVMSVSFEGAQKYCEWLTRKYNDLPGRKFRKVVFRLPTEEEWMKAVDVYPGARFPWYGETPYNENRKFYANLKYHVYDSKAISEYIEDGCFFPGPPEYYKPNRLGLYNMIGNVAEMTSTKGVAKGGSWDNFADESGVNNRQMYSEPDMTIGFRVFMEVVEK